MPNPINEQKMKFHTFTYTTQLIAGKHAHDSFVNHFSWVFHMVLEPLPSDGHQLKTAHNRKKLTKNKSKVFDSIC
jgi:hypothetical protein